MKCYLFVFLLAGVSAKHEMYDGWKSYSVGPSTPEHFIAISAMVEKYQLDFLSRPVLGRHGVTLVKPKYQAAFIKELDDLNISYKVHSDNIKKSLEYDDQRIEARRNDSLVRNHGKVLAYDNYHQLETIYEYMEDVARRYPDLVTIVTAGNSFENRPVKYLKISTSNFADESKKVIFIDGGIHSREWISPPSVTYAIHKLVEDVSEPDLLQNFDWILMPVVNPDGYVFSFRNNRFWRKTRSTNTHILSSLCPGVDGNRNYDFYFNTVGVSPNPCQDIYPGNRAFSEAETGYVRDILQEYIHRMALYLTIHSYGSMILYPWGHDGSLSNNALVLHNVGVAMAEAIDARSLSDFPKYIVGNSALVLDYAASGGAEDYAHSIGVPLSYTYELPGLSSGYSGFHLDPMYIDNVVKETWEGFVVGARRAGELLS